MLRVLTDDSASATGLTMALQFLPMLLLSAHAGLVADRVDQRKFLILTQSAMRLVSAVVAIDVLAGTARLWHPRVTICTISQPPLGIKRCTRIAIITPNIQYDTGFDARRCQLPRPEAHLGSSPTRKLQW